MGIFYVCFIYLAQLFKCKMGSKCLSVCLQAQRKKTTTKPELRNWGTV